MKWERVEGKDRTIESSDDELDQELRTSARVYVRRGSLGPGKKWGHTCNTVQKEGQTLFYVFGGYGGFGAGDNSITNDLYVFDTERQIWSQPKAKGMPPCPRDSHSCTTVGHRLFVFGGTNGKKPLRDLHIFDTGLNYWFEPITTGRQPSARESHSAALVGHRLFVFGDVESFIGSVRKRPHLTIYTLVWNELATFGQKLPPRCGHTAVALGESLFVFGGYGQGPKDHQKRDPKAMLGDLHVLNVESGIWTKESMIGAPSPRFGFAGDCVDPMKKILFFGGCDMSMKPVGDLFLLDPESDPMMN